MENLFIARQPIYDASLNVMGYELLYRSGDMDHAVFEDGNQASCETILNSFMHIGVDHLVGSSLVFVNLPTEFIVNEMLTPMFKEQCVLEILEDVEPTEEVIAGIKRLKAHGFQIALDDFVHNDSLEPFIDLADYIKVDVIGRTEAEIAQSIAPLKRSKAKIIAEKVETQEMQSLCLKLGFDYFQGYFFCRPQVISHKHVPSNKAVILCLINKLQDPHLDFDELERILAQDVTLSYKLLRYINSAMFSLRREVDSIKDAIILLGIDNLRQWITLISMTKVVDIKPNELMVTAMIRGRMCELVAAKLYPHIQHQVFVMGLFSLLDALMDADMIDLLDTVILSTPIKMALLDHSGEHGEVLKLVLDYEQAHWDVLAANPKTAPDLTESYIQAVEWADMSIRSLIT
jgi:EAL and modified HD-GYP domain-containing signal transduction protein